MQADDSLKELTNKLYKVLKTYLEFQGHTDLAVTGDAVVIPKKERFALVETSNVLFGSKKLRILLEEGILDERLISFHFFSHTYEPFSIQKANMLNQTSLQEFLIEEFVNIALFLGFTSEAQFATAFKAFFEAFVKSKKSDFSSEECRSVLTSVEHIIVKDVYYEPTVVNYALLNCYNLKTITFLRRKEKCSPKFVKMFFNTSVRRKMNYIVPKGSRALFSAWRGRRHLPITIKTL